MHCKQLSDSFLIIQVVLIYNSISTNENKHISFHFISFQLQLLLLLFEYNLEVQCFTKYLAVQFVNNYQAVQYNTQYFVVQLITQYFAVNRLEIFPVPHICISSYLVCDGIMYYYTLDGIALEVLVLLSSILLFKSRGQLLVIIWAKR